MNLTSWLQRCAPIIVAVLLIIAGIIVTVVGHVDKPFFSEKDASWCSFCREDREKTLRNLRNCRRAGPAILGIGIFMLVVTIVRAKRLQKNEPVSNLQTGTVVATHPNTRQTHLQQPLIGYSTTSSTTLVQTNQTNPNIQAYNPSQSTLGYNQPMVAGQPVYGHRGYPSTVPQPGYSFPPVEGTGYGIAPALGPSPTGVPVPPQSTLQGQTNYPPPPTYADATSDSNAYPEPSAPPK